MITKLKIANFKSHLNTELNMGALTVLTGINSSGKSSVLQSLLLLRQSYQKHRLRKGLDLNKPLYDTGKGKDVLSRFAKSDIITFIVEADEKYEWNFDTKDKLDDTFIPCTKKTSVPETFKKFSLFTSNFQYLSASRWGGHSSYPKDSYAVENEKQLSIEYGQGELVAHFLNLYGTHRDFNIWSENILHPSNSSKKLLEQTIAWENEISPRVTMTVEEREEKIIIEYGYEKTETCSPIKGLRAENMGFGISYSLPIIVALLAASPGSLLIIENPEAHLHPRGQSKLAELIALAAQAGIQIILETHSDHIINGILVACKKFENNEKGVDKNLVKIYHFTRDEEKHCAIPNPINILQDGKIDTQPEGFFDQTENDLNYLLGF
jgi:predicted ATPase